MKYALILVSALLALMTSAELSAHEGHRENMSDAEMAGMPSALADDGQACMEACMAQTAGTEGSHEGHWMTPPDADDAASEVPASMGELALQEARERNRAKSFGDVLGRIHPMAVHFPVALLLMAAFAELMLLARPMLGLKPTIRFLTGTGAVGAVLAAFLGWFAGGWRLNDRSETLALHRWNGTAIALVSMLAWWLAGRAQDKRVSLRIVLAVLGVALLAQGYLGGEMVFGPNHLGLQ